MAQGESGSFGKLFVGALLAPFKVFGKAIDVATHPVESIKSGASWISERAESRRESRNNDDRGITRREISLAAEEKIASAEAVDAPRSGGKGFFGWLADLFSGKSNKAVQVEDTQPARPHFDLPAASINQSSAPVEQDNGAAESFSHSIDGVKDKIVELLKATTGDDNMVKKSELAAPKYGDTVAAMGKKGHIRIDPQEIVSEFETIAKTLDSERLSNQELTIALGQTRLKLMEKYAETGQPQFFSAVVNVDTLGAYKQDIEAPVVPAPTPKPAPTYRSVEEVARDDKGDLLKNLAEALNPYVSKDSDGKADPAQVTELLSGADRDGDGVINSTQEMIHQLAKYIKAGDKNFDSLDPDQKRQLGAAKAIRDALSESAQVDVKLATDAFASDIASQIESLGK